MSAGPSVSAAPENTSVKVDPEWPAQRACNDHRSQIAHLKFPIFSLLGDGKRMLPREYCLHSIRLVFFSFAAHISHCIAKRFGCGFLTIGGYLDGCSNRAEKGSHLRDIRHDLAVI